VRITPRQTAGWARHLETSRCWREAMHKRCRNVTLDFSALAYPAAGGGSNRTLRREVGEAPPRILARFTSEPPNQEHQNERPFG